MIDKIEQKIEKLIEEAQQTKINNVPCEGIKEKKGFSCGQDKNGFYIYTHRARSKSYKTLADIPIKDINFIDSTG